MFKIYITKAKFDFGVHTFGLSLNFIETSSLNTDSFRNRLTGVTLSEKSAKDVLIELKAYINDPKADSKFSEIIDMIMKYSKTKDKFDIQELYVEIINTELSKLVFKDVLDLFEIKKNLTYEQAKQVVDVLFIIDPVHNS